MKMDFTHLEKYRMSLGNTVGYGTHPSSNEGDRFGFFVIPLPEGPGKAMVMACSSAVGDPDIPPELAEWDHVSVHIRIKRRNGDKMRTPTWDEMCFINDLFFDEDECTVQFHPPRNEYVNVHPHVLHIWQHQEGHTLPPTLMV